MKTTSAILISGLMAAVLFGTADSPRGRFGLTLMPEANAGLVVAPVRRTAVVTTAVVASSSANANAAATANANAAAASANASTATGAPPPPGTIVTTLPPGCQPHKLNQVDYMRCGSTYYKAQMMGNNLVFVVAQP